MDNRPLKKVVTNPLFPLLLPPTTDIITVPTWMSIFDEAAAKWFEA